MLSIRIGYRRLMIVKQLEESKAGYMRKAMEEEETEEYTSMTRGRYAEHYKSSFCAFAFGSWVYN